MQGREQDIDEVFDKTTQHRILVGARWAVAAGFVALLLVWMDPHWYWPGLVVSALGMLLQLWVIGSIRSRKLLPVDGAYMFVRHPTYVARFVFVLGLVMMMGEPWLLLIYVAIYLLYARNGVGLQEQQREEEFGYDYWKYSQHVPLYVPRMKPYPEGRFWVFSMKSFRRQYGEIFIVLSILLYVACYVVAFHVK